MKTFISISLAAFLIMLQGCAVLPVPASGEEVVSGKRIQSSDLEFVRYGDTTREQFEAKIGTPWQHYAELRVSVYFWERLAGRWLWGYVIPAGIGAAGGGSVDMTRLDVLFVKFDEKGRVEKFQIVRHPKRGTTKDAVEAWVRSP